MTSYVLIKRAKRGIWPIQDDAHAADIVRGLRTGSIDITIFPLSPNGDRYPWLNGPRVEKAPALAENIP